MLAWPVAVALPPLATLPWPVAVARVPFARALTPVAVAKVPFAWLKLPVAVAWEPFALALTPVAVAKSPFAMLLAPNAVASKPFAMLLLPTAVANVPFALAAAPHAVAEAPVATAPAPVCASAPVALTPQTSCAAAGDGASIGAAAASPVTSAKPRSVPPESALLPSKPARPPARFRVPCTSAGCAAVFRRAIALSNAVTGHLHIARPGANSLRLMVLLRCAAHQFIRVLHFASEHHDSAKRSHSEAVCDSNSVRWRTHRTILCECGKSATNCLNSRGPFGGSVSCWTRARMIVVNASATGAALPRQAREPSWEPA